MNERDREYERKYKESLEQMDKVIRELERKIESQGGKPFDMSDHERSVEEMREGIHALEREWARQDFLLFFIPAVLVALTCLSAALFGWPFSF